MEDDSSQQDENSGEYNGKSSAPSPSEMEDSNSQDTLVKHDESSQESWHSSVKEEISDGKIKSGKADIEKEENCFKKGVDSSNHNDENDKSRTSHCEATEFTPSNDDSDKTSGADELTPQLDNVSEKSSGKKRFKGRKRGRRKLYHSDNSLRKEDDNNKESEAATNDNIKEEANSRLTEQEDNDNDSDDVPRVKRTRRKTLSNLRDSSIYKGDDLINEERGLDDELELPPKRRRKKARPRTASLESDHSDLQPSDLELGYKILEQIMVFPTATPFLDRPDENAYGMKDYFEVIKSPIWLKEIDRKYRDEEYSNVTELVRDIRHVFENCYHYWGAGDPLSKKALRVEEFLEKKIALLPPSVKQQCSLEATHGEVPGEDDVEDEINKEEPQTPETKRYCQMIKKIVTPKGKHCSGSFVSKLLRRIVNDLKSDPNSLVSMRRVEIEEIGKDVEDWENSVLLVGDVLNQISAMWELPVIGHFFYLTFNVLSIEPISQFELERMLLVPQASVMLAKVMTTMLIPPLSRAKLEVGPPMPYNIWTSKLKTKVAAWYKVYRSAGDQTLKVFEQIGVEPEFWLVMGEKNPFKDCEFHELSFLQRVWLLKSLCDYLLHNHKTIQDVINNIEPEELREKCLGKDRAGYTYHYFPEFNEVRIYKQAKVTESKWQGFEAGVEEAITGAADDFELKSDHKERSLLSRAAGIKKLLYRPPKSVIPCADNFKLVASSVEDIRCLIDEFCSNDPQVVQGRGALAPLVIRLNAIISEVEPIERKLISTTTYIRKKMHKEWTDYKNRDLDYVDPGVAYWERREKDHPEKDDKSLSAQNSEPGPSAGSSDQPDTSERRERRSKRESHLRYIKMDFDGIPASDEGDEEYFEEEADDSEDEWTACPSKKKKKSSSNKRMKKLNSFSEQIKFQPDAYGNNNWRNSIEMKIKPENIKVEKQDYVKRESNLNVLSSNPSISIKQEPGAVSYSPKIKQELQVPSQTVVRTLVKFSTPVQQFNSVPIKKSNSPEPEIVEISDEDPDSPPDVKPVLEDLRSIKTVDCVVPLVDQRVGPRPPFSQSQFLGQYPNNSGMNVAYTPNRDNTVFMNNMTNITPIITQVRGSPQQVVPTVRSPHNQNLIYSQNNITPPKLSSPSFVNSAKNVLQPNTSPQARNNQTFFMNPQNKNQSPNNRAFTNSSSPQQINKSVPRQSFIRNPTMQRSPRGGPPLQNMSSPRGPIMPSPGRGRPRSVQNIQMPTPPRGSAVRQVSPQQIMNKSLMNSPQIRQRSPSLSSQRNITPPQPRTPGSSFNSSAGNNRFQNSKMINQPVTPQARRNLNFSSSSRPVRQEPPLQIVNTGNVTGKNVTTVEGKLLVALTDDGSYGYHVVLPDGGRVTLTNSQLSELRAKNNGSLPQKVGVPMVQSSD